MWFVFVSYDHLRAWFCIFIIISLQNSFNTHLEMRMMLCSCYKNYMLYSGQFSLFLTWQERVKPLRKKVWKAKRFQVPSSRKAVFSVRTFLYGVVSLLVCRNSDFNTFISVKKQNVFALSMTIGKVFFKSVCSFQKVGFYTKNLKNSVALTISLHFTNYEGIPKSTK